MTREEREEICTYVAQNLISPIYDINVEVWSAMTKEPFVGFCCFTEKMVDKQEEK